MPVYKKQRGSQIPKKQVFYFNNENKDKFLDNNGNYISMLNLSAQEKILEIPPNFLKVFNQRTQQLKLKPTNTLRDKLRYLFGP